MDVGHGALHVPHLGAMLLAPTLLTVWESSLVSFSSAQPAFTPNSFTDTAVCTCCCAALDNVVSRLFRILNRHSGFINGDVARVNERHRDVIETQREQHFVQVMRERPELLQKVVG